MHCDPTPFEPFRFRGIDLHVKRDDLIHPLLSGNKYRKLFSRLHTDPGAIDTLVSYGGVQSNAMLSIAALCHEKGWRFEYTAKTVPEHLKANPYGNYAQALDLGMYLVEVPPRSYDAALSDLRESYGMRADKTLLVPQGGADPAARIGVEALADEIRAWMKDKGIDRLTVATPSGTGTTAAYLAASLPECHVVTVAAVGGPTYLKTQISALLPVPKNLRILPTRFRFAAPYPELLNVYEALKTAGIEFDLVYATVMWMALLEYRDTIKGALLYVHSGGVGGNESMLARYARL